MADQLHQMTVSFSPQEDRLLLRFGTTSHIEYRLWLTRRLVTELWKGLVKAVENTPDVKVQSEPRVRQAILSMRHQEAVKGGDFSQKPDPVAQPHPLSEKPMLVVGIKSAPAPQGKTALSFQVEGQKDIGLVLDDKIIHALCHLIVTGVSNAKWGLKLTVADPSVLVAASNGKVH
jgi:hypothetical protein